MQLQAAGAGLPTSLAAGLPPGFLPGNSAAASAAALAGIPGLPPGFLTGGMPPVSVAAQMAAVGLRPGGLPPPVTSSAELALRMAREEEVAKLALASSANNAAEMDRNVSPSLKNNLLNFWADAHSCLVFGPPCRDPQTKKMCKSDLMLFTEFLTTILTAAVLAIDEEFLINVCAITYQSAVISSAVNFFPSSSQMSRFS